MATARVARWPHDLVSVQLQHSSSGREKATKTLMRCHAYLSRKKQLHGSIQILQSLTKLQRHASTCWLTLTRALLMPRKWRVPPRKTEFLPRWRRYIQEGWPAHKESSWRSQGICTQEGRADSWQWRMMLSYGDQESSSRTIQTWRKESLEELHSTHPGIVKMKALARSYVWWPRIDNQLEQQVKSCPSCQQSQHSPASIAHPPMGISGQAMESDPLWLRNHRRERTSWLLSMLTANGSKLPE